MHPTFRRIVNDLTVATIVLELVQEQADPPAELRTMIEVTLARLVDAAYRLRELAPLPPIEQTPSGEGVALRAAASVAQGSAC